MKIYISFHELPLIDERQEIVLFVAVACSFTAGIIIYLNFGLNKPSVLFKSNDSVNWDRRSNAF